MVDATAIKIECTSPSNTEWVDAWLAVANANGPEFIRLSVDPESPIGLITTSRLKVYVLELDEGSVTARPLRTEEYIGVRDKYFFLGSS